MQARLSRDPPPRPPPADMADMALRCQWVRDVVDEARPPLGVVTWEFEDSDTAQEFWNQLLAHEVYQSVGHNRAILSAMKTLSALGYSITDFPGGRPSNIVQATKWSCSLQAALIKPYCFASRLNLDENVKDAIKDYDEDFETHVFYKPPFKEITSENVCDVVQSFFPFEQQTVHWERRKLRELVAISELLRAFHADAKINVLA
jgi:hypothetical protein